MKKYYISLIMIIFIIFTITIISMNFMPETVPMHFDLQGNVNRYGPKYEVLLFPFIASIVAIILAFFANYLFKNNKSHDAKLMCGVAIAILLMFTMIQFSFLYVDVYGLNRAVDIAKVPLLAVGCLFIFLGFIMPSSDINNYFGVRFPWTMKNGESWKRSQKLAGLLSIIFGVLILLSSFILTNEMAIIGLLVLIVLWLIFVSVGTYIICK